MLVMEQSCIRVRHPAVVRKSEYSISLGTLVSPYLYLIVVWYRPIFNTVSIKRSHLWLSIPENGSQQRRALFVQCQLATDSVRNVNSPAHTEISCSNVSSINEPSEERLDDDPDRLCVMVLSPTLAESTSSGVGMFRGCALIITAITRRREMIQVQEERRAI